MTNRFADTPKPPYYVVTFTSLRTEGDKGYGDMADKMVEMAKIQPGYLGVESVRDKDGYGITNSYWVDEDSIKNWKRVVDHLEAQSKGRSDWYQTYRVRVARVERAYGYDSTS